MITRIFLLLFATVLLTIIMSPSALAEGNDTDDDGYADDDDAFPDDPAASKDSDEDGFPDEWNPGKSQPNSTTGLRIDLFPNDSAASIDSDGDGFPDEWNSGMSQLNSTTGLSLDAFPDNSNEWKDSDGDGYGDNSDAFPNNRYQWIDSDNDGINDGQDDFPYDPNEWEDWDGDGYGDNFDDAFPTNYFEWLDSDGDGIGDNSDILVNTPNNYIYIISVPLIIIIGAIAIEYLLRDSLKNTQEKLTEFINEGIENENITSAKENTENLSGLVLFSSPFKEAKNLVSTTLKMKAESMQALEKISLLRNNASEMEKEKINVDNFNKQIDKIEGQLLKQTKTDFGKKYLGKINKELIEKVAYGGYTPGTKVSHVKFGLGKIKDCKPKGENYKLDIDFEEGKSETLLSTFIKIVSEEVKK